jgi:hypothetical protein
MRTKVKASNILSFVLVIAGSSLNSAHAGDYCIAVNGGFGAGGHTFVGKGFSQPANGTCKPWSGIMKTASSVVGTSSGSGCLSSDGKLLTLSVSTTGPYFGNGVAAVDHIQICPPNSGQDCNFQYAGFDYGTFSGTAAKVRCTSQVTTIPSYHD